MQSNSPTEQGQAGLAAQGAATVEASPAGPGASAPSPAAPTPSTPLNSAPSADPIASWHSSAKAQFDKVQEAHQHVLALRSELDRLSDLGDFIQPDDVVKSAAALVGKGFHPKELAALLAEMPMHGGEMLQQWILTHEQMLQQVEAAAGPILAATRHNLATASLHVLARDHLQQGQGSAPAGPAPNLAISTMTPQGNA